MADDQDPSDIEARLKDTLDEVEWSAIRPHAERDGVILISQRIDLLEAGRKIAADDKNTVQAWIQQGLLTKPTREQLDAWNAQPNRSFRMVIVQPYVLVQELVFH